MTSTTPIAPTQPTPIQPTMTTQTTTTPPNLSQVAPMDVPVLRRTSPVSRRIEMLIFEDSDLSDLNDFSVSPTSTPVLTRASHLSRRVEMVMSDTGMPDDCSNDCNDIGDIGDISDIGDINDIGDSFIDSFISAAVLPVVSLTCSKTREVDLRRKLLHRINKYSLEDGEILIDE